VVHSVGFATGPSNDPVPMTPPENEEVRARVLFAACGFGVAALVAVGVLLLLGLKRTDAGDVVFAARSHATSSAPRDQARRTALRRSEALSAEIPNGQLFSRTSFWNERLSATTPLDPNSAVLVQGLVAEVQRERTAAIGPWIGASPGSTPLYRVARTQSRVRVRLDGHNSHGKTALQRAFASVPIPRDAKPAVKPDRHMTIWQPSTDTLWEFFGAHRRSDGWHAEWGGAIRRVSRSPGYYTRAAWPGASRNWGATASSLPVIGGTMLLDELKAGRVDHALAINLPNARGGVFAWPAQRTDGTGPPTALPEGARLRLDPALDVGALHLPKLTRMIALAAQRYGLVVRDLTHHAISLFGENPSQFPGNPYRRYFQGRTPQAVLANFPWDRLQVLQMHLCTAAPCDRS
jgi:hypothetical protein